MFQVSTTFYSLPEIEKTLEGLQRLLTDKKKRKIIDGNTTYIMAVYSWVNNEGRECYSYNYKKDFIANNNPALKLIKYITLS